MIWFLIGFTLASYLSLVLYTFCFDFMAYITGRSEKKPHFNLKFWAKS